MFSSKKLSILGCGIAVAGVVFGIYLVFSSAWSRYHPNRFPCVPAVTLDEILDKYAAIDGTEINGIEVCRAAIWLKGTNVVLHVDNGIEKINCYLSDGTNEKSVKVHIFTQVHDGIDSADIQYIVDPEDEYTVKTVMNDGVLSEIYFEVKQ